MVLSYRSLHNCRTLSVARIFFGATVLILTGLAPRATAAPVTVSVGIFSFDVLIPGAVQFPGLNQFTIDNLTGANNLPNDFPIADSLTFQNVSVTVGPQTISLPDIGVGSVQPSNLTFVDSVQFASAEFQGTVVGTRFQLADGSFLDLTSDAVSGTILPSQGGDLMAGVDSVLLTVTGTISMNSAPEPGSLALLLVAGLVVVAAVFRKSSNGSC